MNVFPGEMNPLSILLTDWVTLANYLFSALLGAGILYMNHYNKVYCVLFKTFYISQIISGLYISLRCLKNTHCNGGISQLFNNGYLSLHIFEARVSTVFEDYISSLRIAGLCYVIIMDYYYCFGLWLEC